LEGLKGIGLIENMKQGDPFQITKEGMASQKWGKNGTEQKF